MATVNPNIAVGVDSFLATNPNEGNQAVRAIEWFTSSTASKIDMDLIDTENHSQQNQEELKDRIKQLEDELMDAKNQYAVLLADVALYEDRGERIKRLEEFARTIENDFDHDEDAHRYGTTCRVCDAEDLLKETKAKEANL